MNLRAKVLLCASNLIGSVSLLTAQDACDTESMPKTTCAFLPYEIEAVLLNIPNSHTMEFANAQFESRLRVLERLSKLSSKPSYINNYVDFMVTMFQQQMEFRDLNNYERILKCVPDNAEILNSYGWRLLLLNELDKAYNVLRRIHNPSEAQADSLAWTLYKMNRPVDALHVLLEYFNGTNKTLRHHPIIFNHAGDLFYTNGFYTEASKMWRRSILEAKSYNQDDLIELQYDIDSVRRKYQAIQILMDNAKENSK